MTRRWLWNPALVLLALVVASCGGSADETTAPVASTNPSVTEPTVPPTTAIATTVPATTAPAPTLPPVPSLDFTAVSDIVDGFVTERGLNGAGLVIVQRDDGIVYHEHWGEFDERRISLIASSSKMITAGVLMRLHDDGLLDIDAPVADVVEWGSGHPEITPAQLVSNSSGLVGLLPDPGYGPYVCQFLPSGSLQECGQQIFTTPGDDADLLPPDTQFRYGGAQWQVAGAVAEAASGKSWAELIEEIYVRPCGVESLAYNNHFTQIGAGGFTYPVGFNSDPSQLAETDNPSMEGGAYITTGDYATLLLMHLRGGRCGAEQVLSTESIDRLHADRIGEVYDGSAGVATGYGMGWWVDRATGRLSDAGAYGSVPWLDLDDGYGAYLVIEADAGTGIELASMLFDPVEQAFNARG